jgi:hypothetical protein
LRAFAAAGSSPSNSRAGVGQVEHAELMLVVGDDVEPLFPPDQPAGCAQVARAAGSLDRQRPNLLHIQHRNPLPPKAGAGC